MYISIVRPRLSEAAADDAGAQARHGQGGQDLCIVVIAIITAIVSISSSSSSSSSSGGGSSSGGSSSSSIIVVIIVFYFIYAGAGRAGTAELVEVIATYLCCRLALEYVCIRVYTYIYMYDT